MHRIALKTFIWRMQNCQNDGSTVSEDINYLTVNLFTHSWFYQVDLEIGGIILTTHNSWYPYKTYLGTLLTYNYDVKFSLVRTSHFIKDTSADRSN